MRRDSSYASVALWIYLVVKFADLAARDALQYLVQPGVESVSFWVEVGLGILLPAALYSSRSLRQKPAVLLGGAVMVVLFGIVLNRLNVSMIGLYAFTGYIYYPSWMEILVSVTIISLGVLVFGLAAKHLPLFPEHAHD